MSVSLPRVIVVTGTDTGVGKTVVTAALCSALSDRGPIAAYKPVQTGVAGDPADGDGSDVDEVRRLAGLRHVYEGARLADPLSPLAAARRQRAVLPSMAEHVTRVVALAADHRYVVVEGAGGALVGLDDEGKTLLDLVGSVGIECAVLVVCHAGLGTLNHAALTLEALRTRHLPSAGLVIGSWPDAPGLAELYNLSDLPALTGISLLGRLPERAAQLAPEVFRASAPSWFAAPIGSWQP